MSRWTDEATKATIVDRYKAGESMRAIAAALGLHSHTVRRLLKKAGVELRPDAKRGEPFNERWISPTVAAQMVRRYEAGESIRVIATWVGYSYGAVRGSLVRSGVTFRRGVS